MNSDVYDSIWDLDKAQLETNFRQLNSTHIGFIAQ